MLLLFFFTRLCFTLSAVVSFPSSVTASTTTSSWRSIWIPYKRWTVCRTNHQLLAHPQVYNTVFCEAKNKIKLSTQSKCSNWWVLNKIALNQCYRKINNNGDIILVHYRLCLGCCQRCSRSHCWTCTSCGCCSSCRCTHCSSCTCCAPSRCLTLIIVSTSLCFFEQLSTTNVCVCVWSGDRTTDSNENDWTQLGNCYNLFEKKWMIFFSKLESNETSCGKSMIIYIFFFLDMLYIQHQSLKSSIPQ